MRLAVKELIVLGIVSVSVPAFAQSTMDWPTGEFEPYRLDSSQLANTATDTWLVYSNSVTVENSAWLRLYFEEVVLEKGSTIRMTSALDGEVQELDAAGMAMWQNTSAYFNGDTVYIDVFAAAGTTKNRIVLDKVARYETGLRACGETGCGYCGSDDRVPSDEEWTGRLMPVGCTASVYNDQSCLVSAGHCVAGGYADVIQFRVPDSDPDCEPNQPSVSNQFPITDTLWSSDGPGDDWSVLLAGTNNLGQTIYERYGTFRPIATGIITAGERIDVWGYGIDGQPTRNQTQQTADGTVEARFSDRYYVRVDITHGNSGSAVIWSSQIIGIVTHCPCPNVATRIDLAAFRAARDELCPFVLTYCSASSDSDNYEYISNVSVGSIDNSSGPSRYSDYTSQSTTMAIGSEHEITVTLDSAWSSDLGGLWIDWNRDGDFDDADETITTAWSGVGPYSETITVPEGASEGNARMRVRILDGDHDPTPESCGSTSYGEVEDYTVRIDPPPPTCDDGIRNQGEARIDCGGPCSPCSCTSDGQCDNGVYCDGQELCDDYGECQTGPPVFCTDFIDCTDDVCNEETGLCDYIPNDSLCDDGRFCDGEEVCNPASGCEPGPGADCDDLISCTDDSCDEEADQCVHVPNDAFCDDTVYCNGEEYCDPVEGCQPGEAVSCDDEIDCTIDLCYEALRGCLNLPDDTLCDDGLYCTGVESCEPTTGCITSGSPCDDGYWCDEASQSCEPLGDGDLDGDGDVDLADFKLFQVCFGETVPGPCDAANLAGGDTIDLEDYVLFGDAVELSGP